MPLETEIRAYEERRGEMERRFEKAHGGGGPNSLKPLIIVFREV